MDPEILVQRADRALYRAKAEDRSCIRFFEHDMDAHVERRVAIEHELRAAAAAKIIVSYYQPVVAFEGRRVVGFEALTRWKSDRLGWVAPDVFITVAEEIGIISELGDQWLRQACLDASLARGFDVGFQYFWNPVARSDPRAPHTRDLG